jgi:hypothetical protein
MVAFGMVYNSNIWNWNVILVKPVTGKEENIRKKKTVGATIYTMRLAVKSRQQRYDD